MKVKLQLADASKTPEWVTELLNSGKLMEVHKVLHRPMDNLMSTSKSTI